MNAVRQRPGKRPLRLNIGLTDAFPKVMAFQILKAAFRFTDAIHIVCREGEIGPLVNHLQAHRLDIVLSDEPASSALKAKTFNHRLGHSGFTFCAVASLAKTAPEFSAITGRRASLAPDGKHETQYVVR